MLPSGSGFLGPWREPAVFSLEPGPGLEPRRRYQAFPFRSVGSDPAAMESVGGHMCQFMAKDLLQEVFVPVLFQVGGQANPAIHRPASPQ